jgi:molybdate transport system substrate-binding protein
MSVATEITVLSGGAMRRFMIEAVPLFEAASGIKVALRFAQTRVAMKEIEEGAVFDVALLPRWAIDQLTERGKIAPGTAVDTVRSIVGLMVRQGAPAPDIGTVDALKTVLRRAKSISYSKGPSGEYVAELLQRLGLEAEMQDKTVFAVGRFVGEVVANGEAEVGMQQIIESAPVAGAHLVGPLPPELTNYVLYSAGFAANAGNGAAADQFVTFLASPEAAGIIRSKGMEPG